MRLRFRTALLWGLLSLLLAVAFFALGVLWPLPTAEPVVTAHPIAFVGVAGRVADLIVLDADPLADIRHTQRIRAVVVSGNLYDRAALDGIQALVRRRARSWSVACKVLWRFLKTPASY